MNNLLSDRFYGFSHYGVIFLVCFFSFFIHNRVIPADLMEARNLITAHEMVHYGNYLLPTMNGELRLEKPPLPTWIAAGIEHVAPGNLIAQRCASAFMACMMVVFLYLLVSRLTRNRTTGLITSLILATGINVILMGRTASWDIYTHSFMLGAIYFLVVALEEKGHQWNYFLLSGLFMGLSFLSKGPVSFYALLLPFLIGYIMVYRPTIKGKVLPLVSMVAVCLAVSSWWVLYILSFHKDMMLSVGGKESSAWLNYNVRPWYYYWKFPAEAGVWALFLVTSLVYYFINKRTEYHNEYKFSMIWLLVTIFLLSVIPEKKTRYLLPVMISGAMTTGFYMYQMITGMKTQKEKVIFKINAIVIVVILLALPIALYILFYNENQVSLPLLIIIATCTWSIAVFILMSLFRKKEIQAGNVFMSVILSMIVVTAFCLIPIGKMFINEDRHSISILRENTKIQELPFYYNAGEKLRMELVYEANHRILELDLSDEEAVLQAMPFVLVSGLPIDSLLSDKRVEVEKLGTFDNNWIKANNKNYNRDLVKEVAVIRKKQCDDE